MRSLGFLAAPSRSCCSFISKGCQMRSFGHLISHLSASCRKLSRSDPEHTGGIMPYISPGLRTPSLACCHHDPILDRKIMDGWIWESTTSCDPGSKVKDASFPSSTNLETPQYFFCVSLYIFIRLHWSSRPCNTTTCCYLQQEDGMYQLKCIELF